MKFEDKGLVLKSQKYGENSLIVSVLSESNGLVRGLSRNVKKNQSTLQIGNLIEFSWSARLEEHLGMLNANIDRAYSLLCYDDYSKISAISSICALTSIIAQEKEQMSDFYESLINFSEDIVHEDDQLVWLEGYCIAELELLKYSGFGFDFSECSVSGDDEVVYISPKTGAVVSREVGEPYKNKLFKIPSFFLDYMAEGGFSDDVSGDVSMQEIKQAMEITRFFINKNFFAEGLYKMPVAAANFAEYVFESEDRQGIV